MSNTEDKNFKQEYLQKPITFLTEENLDKLEKHCNKAIHYERGIEHRVVLELLERYKEHLAERKQDKARIKELEEALLKVKDKNTTLFITCRNSIPKQKVKDKIEELKKDYEDSKDENGETEYYYPDYTIRKLEELLEDK